MKTDDLIADLSAELASAPRHWIARTVAIGAGLGLLGAGLVWAVFYGPRADLHGAVFTWPFWMKSLYTAALGAGGLWLLARAGRPGAALAPPALTLTLPVALLGMTALLALAAPEADAISLALGHSAATCSLAILLVSLPSLAAAFWTLRHLAPTRLAQAGAGAGLFAGSEGAFVYALYCTEDAALFVALWYTLGILLTATLGALLGRSLLRW